MSLSDEHITKVLQDYVDAVSGDDLEKVIELYAEDAEVEDPVGSEPHKGHEALREFYKEYKKNKRPFLDH